jgi:nitrogen fixation/metabolism regulation signal transduction histidine kinase
MSTVPTLPSHRQRTRAAAVTGQNHVAAQENLTRAFLTFTQAAGSLEKSYTQLQLEVARLHFELQKTNSELERTLEENARVRGYLARVVESLPCGVMVVSADGSLQIINPEARRLLDVAAWSPEQGRGLPPAFAEIIAEIPASSSLCEQETCIGGIGGNRTIGILRASINEQADGSGDTIWIVRDVTEQSVWQRSERLDGNHSHLRNPLGSMEMPPRICRKRGNGLRICKQGCGRCRRPP